MTLNTTLLLTYKKYEYRNMNGSDMLERGKRQEVGGRVWSASSRENESKKEQKQIITG